MSLIDLNLFPNPKSKKWAGEELRKGGRWLTFLIMVIVQRGSIYLYISGNISLGIFQQEYFMRNISAGIFHEEYISAQWEYFMRNISVGIFHEEYFSEKTICVK